MSHAWVITMAIIGCTYAKVLFLVYKLEYRGKVKPVEFVTTLTACVTTIWHSIPLHGHCFWFLLSLFFSLLFPWRYQQDTNSIIALLHWLPPKATELFLFWYYTHSWRKINVCPFPKALVQSDQSRLGQNLNPAYQFHSTYR